MKMYTIISAFLNSYNQTSVPPPWIQRCQIPHRPHQWSDQELISNCQFLTKVSPSNVFDAVLPPYNSRFRDEAIQGGKKLLTPKIPYAWNIPTVKTSGRQGFSWHIKNEREGERSGAWGPELGRRPSREGVCAARAGARPQEVPSPLPELRHRNQCS